MFGRKCSLPDTLQTRYLVDDLATFLFIALLTFGALVLIVAMFTGTWGRQLASKSRESASV